MPPVISSESLSQMQTRKKDAYGCGELYQERANKLSFKLKIFAFIGLAFYVLIGTTMAAFGANAKIGGRELMPILLGITGVVGIAQAVLNLWMLCADWTGNLQYAIESATDNHNLCKRNQELLDQQDSPPDDWVSKATILKNDEAHREALDRKHGITDKDRVFAHRKSLIFYRETCVTCKEMPVDMKKTSCPTCGVF